MLVIKNIIKKCVIKNKNRCVLTFIKICEFFKKDDYCNKWLSFFDLEFILMKSNNTIILTSYKKVSYAFQLKTS